MQDLAPRQQAVLEYVGGFIDEHGCPPSIREIGIAFGIRSTNGVAAHIDALERKGYLEKAGGGRLARSIRLTGKARSGLGSPFSRSVPLLGGVVAGTPVAPASYEGESLQVDPTLLPRDAPTFALTVHGDSMVEDAILDGDIVLVRAQGEARPHDVVVAVLDGETTVKRYELRESGPFLVPANAGMRPIPLAGRQFSIAGVVVGLMRKLH